MVKRVLKTALSKLGGTPPVRWTVGALVYPNVLRYLRDEIVPDVPSPSGVVESLAWKIHSYVVLSQELTTGVNCCPDNLRSDPATRAKILDIVLAETDQVPGDILEFGVATGVSLRTFAQRCPERRVYGFDGFDGLPENWWDRPAGTFKTPPPDMTAYPNAELIIGFFDRTLPGFMQRWQGTPAILHIDCDLYSSTVTTFEALKGRMRAGSVVLFDEYYNYPGFAEHEWLAWQQFKAKYGITAHCIAYDGRRAAFRIDKVEPPVN
jgi:Macrocin-O-methyltransferase (TylF)